MWAPFCSVLCACVHLRMWLAEAVVGQCVRLLFCQESMDRTRNHRVCLDVRLVVPLKHTNKFINPEGLRLFLRLSLYENSPERAFVNPFKYIVYIEFTVKRSVRRLASAMRFIRISWGGWLETCSKHLRKPLSVAFVNNSEKGLARGWTWAPVLPRQFVGGRGVCMQECQTLRHRWLLRFHRSLWKSLLS